MYSTKKKGSYMTEEIKGKTEDATMVDEETNFEEKPKSNKLETCEDWQEFFGRLANPKCTKCYGRGYTGWSEFDDKGRMPIGCTAKKCSIHTLRILQREQQIRQMKQKQKKMKDERENL